MPTPVHCAHADGSRRLLRGFAFALLLELTILTAVTTAVLLIRSS